MADEFVSIGADRPKGFALCGEQFEWRGVTPKQYSEWLGEGRRADEDSEEVTWESLCARADQLVLLGLKDDEDRTRYTDLRDGKLNGTSVVPTVQQIIALRNWVMEVETGRPPLPVTPSFDGRTETTDPPSTEPSSEEEETPDA